MLVVYVFYVHGKDVHYNLKQTETQSLCDILVLCSLKQNETQSRCDVFVPCNLKQNETQSLCDVFVH